jgi:alcohol dehydrogenase class IV
MTRRIRNALFIPIVLSANKEPNMIKSSAVAPPGVAPGAEKTLAKVAAALGVPDGDEQAIRSAFEQLFAPIEEVRAAARRKLSQRERTMVASKGIDPAKYDAIKSAIRSRSRGRTL